jgi:RNA polymerase sigma factor (sigma-70 family)
VARPGLERWTRLRSPDPLNDPGPLIRRLYAYVAYRIGDGTATEDVVSRALERAVRYRASYEPSKGTPLAWLIGIANRCIADPGARETLSLEQVGDAADSTNLEDDLVRRTELRQAVAGLDERSRSLIALRYGADMTARQIGEMLNLSPHAVQVALGRALDRLERRMGPTRAGETKPAAENV